MWYYQNKEFTEDQIHNNYGFVYIITNLISEKRYIGKKYFYIKSKELLKKSNWLTYYGSNKELTKDIDLLGKEQFKREILYVYKTKKETDIAEIEEQKKQDVLHKIMHNGQRQYYNKHINHEKFYCSGHTPETCALLKEKRSKQIMKPWSKERRKKHSILLKGKPKPKNFGEKISKAEKGISRPWSGKPIYQFDLQGNFIKEWNTTVEAKRWLGKGNIESCCRKKSRSAGGYMWRYKFDFKEQPTKIDPVKRGTNKGKKHTPEHIQHLKEALKGRSVVNCKPVQQFTLNGSFVREYSSITEAAKSVPNCNIGECCRKKIKTSGGYIWKFKYNCI